MNKSKTQKPKTMAKTKLSKRVTTKLKITKARIVKQKLNGSHGEYTGSDDVNKKGVNKKKKSKVFGRVKSTVRKVASDAYHLTPCAAKYAIAIADPWDKMARGACIPTNPSRPSQKCHGYARGTFAIGKGGVGWIIVSPSVAKDSPAVFFTNVNYISTASIGALSQGGVSSANLANLPYTTAQLSTANSYNVTEVTGRVVAGSLSVRYTGTELERSGTITAYSTPEHTNVNGLTFAAIDGLAEAMIEPVSRKITRVSCFGVTTQELEYPVWAERDGTVDNLIDLVYPHSRGEVLEPDYAFNYGAAVMLIKVTGVEAQTFFFEYIQHNEYTGKGAAAMLTPNSTDAIGLAIVQSAASNVISAKQSDPSKSFGQLMKQELRAAAKEYGPAALKMGASMIMSALT